MEAGSGGNSEGSRTFLPEEGASVTEAVMVDEIQKTPIIFVRKSSHHIREPDRFQEMLNFILLWFLILSKALVKKSLEVFPTMLKVKVWVYIFLYSIKYGT